MFYFRLDRIFIRDNGVTTLLKKRDKADVQIISFITTDNTQLPSLDGYTTETDEAKKKEMLKTAIKNVIASRIFTPVENVKDEHELTFGDTGIALYQSEKIPKHLDWQLVVIGSKKRLRDTAKFYDDVIAHESFDSFINNTLKVLAVSINPVVTASIAIGKYLTRFALSVAQKKKDDQLGIVYQSWNQAEHYPHGKRFKDGISDLTKNMVYDYSMFGISKVAQPTAN